MVLLCDRLFTVEKRPELSVSYVFYITFQVLSNWPGVCFGTRVFRCIERQYSWYLLYSLSFCQCFISIYRLMRFPIFFRLEEATICLLQFSWFWFPVHGCLLNFARKTSCINMLTKFPSGIEKAGTTQIDAEARTSIQLIPVAAPSLRAIQRRIPRQWKSRN